MHAIYGLIIAILASFAIRYQTQLSALTAIENEATALVRSGYSTSAEAQGFILASLSFLEKHKNELPDTYGRAVQLAESCGATVSAREYQARMDLWDAADAMRSLLRGIASSKK
ncbi:MAG: hypothetical protein IPN38_11480 [Flavobacteriales bacterium]|nr:hypothetical protein [Flavobacteriales bacterium]